MMRNPRSFLDRLGRFLGPIAMGALLSCSMVPKKSNPSDPTDNSLKSTRQPALATSYKVIGYVPAYRGNVSFVRYDKLTHINYAFLVVREDGTYTGEYDANLLPQVVTNAHAQGVKVLISVGGGSNANAMTRAITNAAYANSATTLETNLVNFMTSNDLDGVDIDWEYPQSATDSAAFDTFITKLAADVHAKGKLLTAATVGADWVGKWYSSTVVNAFDWLNVMAYDVAGTNHSSYQIASDQLAYWAARGVPASKLVLGVPFYGYPSPSFSWSAMAYKDILAADPNAYNTDFSSAVGYAYNGVPTMIQKTQLAMTNASGIMIWELSMDSAAGNHSLLDAIASTISGGAVTTYTISASAGSNGSISPSGSVSVVKGANQTFTITPASGYNVDTVTVDGASQGSITSYTFSNVQAAHTISATFKVIPVTTYAITASAGANGTISPSGSVTVNQGASQTFAIAANSGYSIGNVTVDGASVGAVASYTFSNVTANHTIAATFNQVVASSNLALGKTATASSVETSAFPASYAVDGNTSTRWASLYSDPSWITIDLGATTTFNRVVLRWEAAYATAYQIRVSANNSTWTTVYTKTGGTGGIEDFTFTPQSARYVQMYGTARATQWGYSLWEFEVYNTATTYYTISASAGSNGSISPSGSVSVAKGANQAFTITPASGYTVDTVTVDGVSQGSITSYTFSNVQAAHTISATFKVIPVTTYTITASAGSNGTISPSGSVTVNSGSSQTFSFTPASGYVVNAVTVDGASAGSGTTYTFSNVTANHTISVTFKQVTQYTLTASAGSNGTISPNGTVSVNSGASQTFTMTPASGYVVNAVTVDGVSAGAVTTYTFSNVTANHTISVTFKQVAQYTLTANAGANGTISPSGTVTVNSGASQTFTMTPASGYVVDTVTVDGASAGSVTTYTFSNVTANHTISVTFKASGGVKATGVPGNPHLSSNATGASSFTLHVTMWYGNNGSSWVIYENGTQIANVALVDNSPNQQDADYVVSGKAKGTYSYTCKLVNSFGSSILSDPLSVTVTTGAAGDTQAPTAPTNLASSAVTSSSVSLSWTAATDNVGVTGYVVSYGSSSTTVTGTSATITGLTASTSYAFSVKALDAAGNQSSAATLSVTTGAVQTDTQAPTAPTNLVATGTTSTSISLSWTASTDNVGVTGYVITYGSSSVTVTGTTATISGLTASTSYTFSVKAVDAAGNQSSAATLTASTSASQTDTQAPTAPTNLAATGHTSSNVALSWTASTDNVGVTGYNVLYGSNSVSVTGTSTTISGLSASTSYTFTVKAKDAAGNLSAASNSVTVTTDAAGSIIVPAQMLYDDFSYTSSDDTNFLANWKASDYSPAAPGLGSFSKNNVQFVADPNNSSNKLMKILFTTQGSRETTVEGEVEGQRRFLYGTYASRMKFYNQPVSGPAQTPGPDTGDHMVCTFFTISPYYVPNTEYGELDFEYLPNAGWNGDGPRFTTPTMWNTTWETRDVRITKATATDCSGWHTFWMTVTPTAVSYYMDDTLLVTHTDTTYIPETEMLVMWNLWLTGEQFAQGQSGISRTWEEDVDWFYHGKDTTMTRADIENAVAYYKSKGISKVDTMPAPILPPAS